MILKYNYPKLTLVILLVFISQLAVAKMRIHENVSFEDFPQRLKDNIEHQIHWKDGFLDVTRLPYSALGNGISDDTEAIQNAIDDAFAANLVVYFPPGTYLVSDQLKCIQPQGSSLPVNPISAKSQRKFGHLLVGSDNEWPTIKLKDSSTVEENILIFFAYINDEGITESSRHYLASIRNFNIDMGNNPDVSALSNSGAQYAVIQNINIYGDFDAGIYRVPGSGGYSANITITGGQVGIRQDEYRPCPTIFGLKLSGQSKYGIELLNARGALTVAGFEITGPADEGSDYSAVFLKNTNSNSEQGAVADLVLKDGSITSGSSNDAIFNYNQNIVLENVWIKSGSIISSGINSQKLAGDSENWKYLAEYVFAAAVDSGTVSINGELKKNNSSDIILVSELKDSLPAEGLLERHLWGEMPSWEDEHVNVVNDFGVTPDNDLDDDAIKLQEAIDAVCTPGNSHYGKTLFIPRGYYHLKSTLVLRKNLKMLGAGKNISVIAAATEWLPENPVSVVSTVNEDMGNIKLSDFALFLWTGSVDNGTQNRKNLTLLDFCAGNSIIRDVQTDIESQDWKYNTYAQPAIRFSESAGGKIYGLCGDLGTKGAVEDTYSMVSIKNTRNSLVFYQTSIEDVSEATSQEEQQENLLQLKIDSSKDVSIYGFKYEGKTQHMLVKDTDSFQVYGGAGNYWMIDERRDAIFEIENTKNVFIANMSHDPKEQLPGKSFLKDDSILINHKHPIVLYRKTEKTPDEEEVHTEEMQEHEELLVYPIPVNDFLHISSIKQSHQYNYRLFNVYGAEVQYGLLSNNYINCSSLESGIYILNIYFEKQTYNTKVLVN